MKVRIISGLVGILVLLFVLAFFDTLLVHFAVALISAVAVYEILHAAKYHNNKPLMVVCIMLAFAMPFSPMMLWRRFLPLAVYAFMVVLFVIFLKFHTKVTFEEVAVSFVSAVLIPGSLTTAILLRDVHTPFTGLYYVILCLGASWLTDTGAYFVGVNFGKHKMCPHISPNKTMEGAVGGILTCTISSLLISYVCVQIAPLFGETLTIKYWLVMLLAPVLSVLSMIGDLTASSIKRQYGIKDFGNIMPGHGGVMDRFDSVLMVLPAVYIISRLIPFVG